jgi:hypothetical protein
VNFNGLPDCLLVFIVNPAQVKFSKIAQVRRRVVRVVLIVPGQDPLELMMNLKNLATTSWNNISSKPSTKHLSSTRNNKYYFKQWSIMVEDTEYAKLYNIT